MRNINYNELKKMFQLLGPQECGKQLSESLQKRELSPEDFSIRELAEVTLGNSQVRQMDPRNSGVSRPLTEAGEGLMPEAFSTITGEIIQSKIMESYQQEAFAVSRKITTISTKLDGELIPGTSGINPSQLELTPGMPYHNVGFTEKYVETPRTTKRGLIVPVTREAIFFDRTHLILQRASEVGEILGLDKEKRILRLVLGLDNNYLPDDTSAAVDTYQVDGDWTNELTTPLEDWESVDTAEQLFAEMIDPSTGEPILIGGLDVLVMPANRHNANRIFNATGISYTSDGAATATIAPNPLGNYSVVSSRLAYRQLAADDAISDEQAKQYWFIGDFKKTFSYMENWPITVTQSAIGSEAEFTHDIFVRYKASERGAAVVVNPRYCIRSTGSGS